MELRPELEEVPFRMRSLPVDRGYPVPWFVAWIDGKPEFRAIDRAKFIAAIHQRLCWVCGSRMGTYLAFVVGPMCAINRISSEPPSHLECAQWSARNCPFLSRPHMVRREDELSETFQHSMAGVAIMRNPGVTMVWVTTGYEIRNDPKGYLLNMGTPKSVEWWAEGRLATRAEVVHSVETGLPALEALAKSQSDKKLLAQLTASAELLYPD